MLALTLKITLLPLRTFIGNRPVGHCSGPVLQSADKCLDLFQSLKALVI